MDLKVENVAELLKVPQSTVSQWVTEGQIPAYHINGEVRFNPKEIESWVLQRKKEGTGPFVINTEDKGDTKAGTAQFSLYRAIHRGFVFHNVPGDTKEEIICATMRQLANELELDAEVLTELLLEREKLMPTALNNGIAVPHTRDFLLNTHFDIVSLVFPEKPIDYEALDGKPVHSMFFLFACEDKNHLNLLAKLAHFASQEEALQMLQKTPPKQQLLEYIKAWEMRL